MIYKSSHGTVYATGDIHGNFTGLVKFVAENLENCDVIVCGDIGVGFEKCAHYENVFAKLDTKLVSRDVKLYMFRGNHDDPAYFNGDNGMKGFDNIILVPDYSVLLSADGYTILMVGGAVSIDRKYRIVGDTGRRNMFLRYHHSAEGFIPTFWPNEEPFMSVEDLRSIEDDGISVNCICTHTCPSDCRPPSSELLENAFAVDPSLREDLETEGGTMDTIRSWMKTHGHPLTRWVFGHYHQHYDNEIEGIRYTALDMYRERRQKPDIIDICRTSN